MSKNVGTLQDKKGNILFPNTIETVTNQYGTAYKFPDGTMICTGKKTGLKVNITTYLHNNNNKNDLAYGHMDAGWTLYPVPFIESPICSVWVASSSNVAFIQLYPNQPLDAPPGFYPYSNIILEMVTDLCYMAIGKWK